MAQLPKSFDEDFHYIRRHLVEHIYVSPRLLHHLLDNHLLNQQHVEEIKVYPFCLFYCGQVRKIIYAWHFQQLVRNLMIV